MTTTVVFGLVAIGLVVSGLLYSRSKRSRRLDLRRREVEFWSNLLGPLLDLDEGLKRDEAIATLCADKHAHPRLGAMRPVAADVKRRLMAMSGGRRRSPAGVLAPKKGASRTGDPLKRVEEDIFWFRLLSALGEMGTLQRDHAMRELSSRPHHHPHLGKHFIDRSTLHQQYQRVRKMSLTSLQDRLRTLKGAAALAAAEVEAARDAATEARSPAPESTATETVAARVEADADPADEAAESTLTGRDDSPKSIAEEIFWFNLLVSLKELPEAGRDRKLEELSGQPHRHPIAGNRLYSCKALRREFEWVKRADVEALHERWNDSTLSALGHEADASDLNDEELHAALGESSERPGLEDQLDALFDDLAGDDAGADRP